jgi:DNA-binding LacI/PurR family transcriptional regulator
VTHQQALLVAAHAQVDVRTVERFERGEPVRAGSRERIEAAMKMLKLDRRKSPPK